MEDEGKDIRFFIKSAIFFMNNTTQHKFRILHSAIETANFFMDVTEVLIVLSRVNGLLPK